MTRGIWKCFRFSKFYFVSTLQQNKRFLESPPPPPILYSTLLFSISCLLVYLYILEVPLYSTRFSFFRIQTGNTCTKGGHSQFQSAPPQFRKIADSKIDWGIAEKNLRNCDCGPSKFDFRNSATFHNLRPVLLLSCPFPTAQDGLKNQPKIFLESSVSMETKNLP